MSLLNPINIPEPTQAQLDQHRKDAVKMKANALTNAPLQNFNALLSQWQNGISLVWEDSSPQDIISAIDAIARTRSTNVSELFALSAKTAAFLESLQTGCTTVSIGKIKAYTVNADGSITVN